MGVSAALFVLLIAVSGLLLNHTEDFSLDSRFVQSQRLLDWYGIKAPDQLRSYSTGQHQVSLLGEQLYLNQQLIAGDYHELAGAALLQGILVIAVDGDLLLLTPAGELIERLRTDNGMPAAIQQLAMGTSDTLLARTDTDIYQSDNSLSRWTQWDGDATQVDWIVADAPEAALTTTMQQHYRAQILPLERVLLDLHSGRLFGHFGVWLFDIAAIVFILLALSGTLIWLKRKH
jgi:hypothetical protein